MTKSNINRNPKRLLAVLSLIMVILTIAVIALLTSLPGSNESLANKYQETNVLIYTNQPNGLEPPKKPKQLLPPEARMIALYGSPDIPTLGLLGEQNIEESVKRVKSLAAEYAPHSKETIIPTFEIITTIASASPTENNDYSMETSIDKLWPWITAAKQHEVYVLLDLQPGYASFLDQAKLYEDLLKEPHVGLALDPEWRLKPGQKHMKQIGSVSAEEVITTAQWLNKLCDQNNLPNKVLLLHQFRLSMIENRGTIDPSAIPNLSLLIQMDGLGNQNVKQDTWRTLQTNLQPDIRMGWKNFIDEDKPMLTPAETMTITPKPYFISYQ